MVTAASVTTASMAAAAVPGKGMFTASVVSSRAYVALAVAGFISLEVIEAGGTALGEGAVVAVTGIEAVIYVSVEAGVAMEPWAGADEDSANEPVGAVIAVRCAVIRRIVEVSVRAHRSDADVDGNLGRSAGGTNRKSKGKHWKCKELT